MVMKEPVKMDKLTEIMNWKRKEIADSLRPVKSVELKKFAIMQRASSGFKQALQPSEGLAVIAEIKRRSPSAGAIATAALDASEQARKYCNGGADALSVLTDEKYFGGRLQDLWEVVEFLEVHQRPTPCLRKDFMFHPFQVLKAAEGGARAILIIVRALSDDEIKCLYDAAQKAGLESLFEIHDENDLERALKHDPEIIGVNNRDLVRFVTDLTISERLIPQVPDEIVVVSESGIHTAKDAIRMKAAGAQALLVGEALMRKKNPGQLIAQLKGLS